MSNVVGLVDKTNIQSIATAIKSKSGNNSIMYISEMSNRILDIPSYKVTNTIDYENIPNPVSSTYYYMRKVYGLCVTQNTYDTLTPVTNYYYAIIDGAVGNKIYEIVECTETEYNLIIPKNNVLYIIKDTNNAITNIIYQTVSGIRLYLNGSIIWQS